MLAGVNVTDILRRYDGLSIVKKLPKVKSNYVLSGSGDRYLIRLGEKSYSSTHQVRKGDNWVTIAKSLFKGSSESVLEKFKNYVETLTKSDYR